MDQSVIFDRNLRVTSSVKVEDATAFAQRTLNSGAASSLAKRLLDIVAASLLLAFLAPSFVVCALLIKLDSRGSIFFLQRRTGLHGRSFRIIKFRTMTVAEDGAEVVQAKRNDMRVTRIGGLLRRSSIDELPQLINVIRGEMSLVGPRPHALAHDEHFSKLAPDYYGRFRVRPGITGLAQVKGYRGEILEPEQIIQRIEYDNLYAESWSFIMDIKILIGTVLVVPFQKTAY
jgi:putative colanic acid biosynthesis UDP-glucose lipid carrier transferase